MLVFSSKSVHRNLHLLANSEGFCLIMDDFVRKRRIAKYPKISTGHKTKKMMKRISSVTKSLSLSPFPNSSALQIILLEKIKYSFSFSGESDVMYASHFFAWNCQKQVVKAMREAKKIFNFEEI